MVDFKKFQKPAIKPASRRVESTGESTSRKESTSGESTSGEDSTKSRGPTTKLLKEELDAFKAEVHATLEELQALIRSTPGAPSPLKITEETILLYSKYILEQDPEIVPKTIKNAIVKNYRRPAEDYARSFVDFLKKQGILKPEA